MKEYFRQTKIGLLYLVLIIAVAVSVLLLVFRKIKFKLVSLILIIVVAVSILSWNAAEEQAEIVSAPRIEPDSDMLSKQRVTWDCVWFGSYPQAEVVPSAEDYTAVNKEVLADNDIIADSDLYNALQNETEWDSNGDITVNGSRYRRIKKSDEFYMDYSEAQYNWEDSDAYHYFKYEPIKWRVLEVDENQALLLSDVVLDARQYNMAYEDSVTWETSTIRSWLNGYGPSKNHQGADFKSGNFIDNAFSDAQKSAIADTSVVNADNISYGTEGGGDTKDKIFLLSETEVYGDKAASYGFACACETCDEARRGRSSTYAKGMGVWSDTSDTYKGGCDWWLRSPGDDTFIAAYVYGDGSVSENGNCVYYISYGVRVALKLELLYNEWSYAGTVSSDGTVNEKDKGESDMPLAENLKKK